MELSRAAIFAENLGHRSVGPTSVGWLSITAATHPCLFEAMDAITHDARQSQPRDGIRLCAAGHLPCVLFVLFMAADEDCMALLASKQMIRCHGDYMAVAIEAAASARQRLTRQGATEEMLARVEARVHRRLKQENPELFDDHT